MQRKQLISTLASLTAIAVAWLVKPGPAKAGWGEGCPDYEAINQCLGTCEVQNFDLAEVCNSDGPTDVWGQPCPLLSISCTEFSPECNDEASLTCLFGS